MKSIAGFTIFKFIHHSVLLLYITELDADADSKIGKRINENSNKKEMHRKDFTETGWNVEK